MPSIIRFNTFTFLWALLILCLSLIPGKSIPVFNWTMLLSPDKMAHIIMYGGLTLLASIGIRKQYTFDVLRFSPGLIALIFGIIYGIVMEMLQLGFMADRYFEILDILANIIGSFAGVIVYGLLYFNL